MRNPSCPLRRRGFETAGLIVIFSYALAAVIKAWLGFFAGLGG
jgi:hypothetical protein